MIIAFTFALATLAQENAPPSVAPPAQAPPAVESAPEMAPTPPAPPAAGAPAEQKQCTLAVLDLDAGEGVAKARAASFTDVVTGEVGAISDCAVLSRADIRGVLSFEAEKQLLGCAADSCIAELAGALGADFLVTGSLAKIDGSTLVALRMTNLKTLKVVRRTTDSYAGDDASAIPFVAWMARKLMTDDPGVVGEKPKTSAPSMSPSVPASTKLVERRSTIWRTLAWTGFISAAVAGVITGGLGATTYAMSEQAKSTKLSETPDFSTLELVNTVGPYVADGTNIGLYVTGALALIGGGFFLLPGEDVVEVDGSAAGVQGGAR